MVFICFQWFVWMKIIKKTFKNYAKIENLKNKINKNHTKITRKSFPNHPRIIPKSFPKKYYNPPKLQVKIGINDNIIIISCTAVQLFQEFIILLKG